MPNLVQDFFRFIREQWTDIPIPTTSLKGKTIAVVGANVGLGFEAAKRLAQLEPDRLVVTGRDAGKGEEAKSPGRRDFASFDSVRAFADELADGKLDALLINAGMATWGFTPTVDGWETTLQVNYLSNALLSVLLLPALVKSSTPEEPSRLVSVSSDAHALVDLEDVKHSQNMLARLNDIEYCTPSNMSKRYHHTKLLGLMLIQSLAARLPPHMPVATFALNPGLCQSQILREAEARGALQRRAIAAFHAVPARSTEVGGRTLVHAVTDPSVRAFHGHFVSTGEVVEESHYLRTPEGKAVAERIWRETIDVLQKVDPRVKQIVSEYLTAPVNESA